MSEFFGNLVQKIERGFGLYVVAFLSMGLLAAVQGAAMAFEKKLWINAPTGVFTSAGLLMFACLLQSFNYSTSVIVGAVGWWKSIHGGQSADGVFSWKKASWKDRLIYVGATLARLVCGLGANIAYSYALAFAVMLPHGNTGLVATLFQSNSLILPAGLLIFTKEKEKPGLLLKVLALFTACIALAVAADVIGGQNVASGDSLSDLALAALSGLLSVGKTLAQRVQGTQLKVKKSESVTIYSSLSFVGLVILFVALLNGSHLAFPSFRFGWMGWIPLVIAAVVAPLIAFGQSWSTEAPKAHQPGRLAAVSMMYLFSPPCQSVIAFVLKLDHAGPVETAAAYIASLCGMLLVMGTSLGHELYKAHQKVEKLEQQLRDMEG